jgi:hypothetical protein
MTTSVINPEKICETWRTVAKMTDSELLAATKLENDTDERKVEY